MTSWTRLQLSNATLLTVTVLAFSRSDFLKIGSFVWIRPIFLCVIGDKETGGPSLVIIFSQFSMIFFEAPKVIILTVAITSPFRA